MILVVDDDKAVRLSLGMILRRAGYEVECVDSPHEALAAVRRHAPRLILMDMNYSGQTTGEDGLELLRKVKILVPETPVILLTAWGSIPLAVEGMRLGAFDFMTKPWNGTVLLQRVATALALCGPVDSPSGEFDRVGIIGKSSRLTEILDTVARIAPTDASVLITGENGTGKELIAKALHVNSRRSGASLVKVNLGGISQSLFESEMFGHVKGAFTGAVDSRKGRFELADKGTIFLDEIGDLDLNCQVKLLRVLQEGTFEPLGDSRPRKVDVRVVSATNVDLPARLKERTFREDLFYRINAISLHLPPLRERREDIPLLVKHFAGNKEFAQDAMELLTRLPWPGNIRQLKNVVERAVLLGEGERISRADIEQADALRLDVTPASTTVSAEGMTLEQLERNAILAALEKHPGNLSLAALELGITRQSLYRRMEKYGIEN